MPVAQPPKDNLHLVERRRRSGHLLRRWALISVVLAAFLALSEADRVYFEEGNLWTSWGTVPFGFLFLIFPVEYAVSTIWTLFTCRRLLRGEKPRRAPRYTNLPLARESITAWPTVTVQVPIYTEPFTDVIRPTLDSALAAIRRYRDQTGQRANLVVCDDGLLHFAENDLADFCARARRRAPSRRTENEREVLARLDYYARHDVSWVARAKHIPGIPETERRGRFKKASNLNHAFMLEEALAKLGQDQLAGIPEAPRPEGSPLPSGLSAFRFAEWGGNVELGEIILQLDKDSICHPDVILATVPEFIEDRNLAYTQHASYPTNETDNYFAMIVGAFTRGLYDIFIPSRCQFDGYQVPVMGHNLFLRKSVLVGIGLWGEMTCEDLDFMMRVHLTGQHGKYVAFPGLEFGEAVTRTYTEEAEKFRRYAFGAAEAILNPVRDWERLGVIKQSFRRFVTSPHVGWYHIVDLIGFFLSMLNIASILPVAVALGLGWVPFGRAFARFLIASAMFLILGSVMFWAVRRKGNLGRMTQGKAWRGLSGGARATAAFLVSGLCFVGYGVGIVRGVAAYLFQRRVSFGATATDDLERVSLGELLRRMKSSHIEAAVLTVVAVGVTWYQSRSPGGTTLAAHFWLLPVVVHLSLPYVMNPYLIRRLYRGPLELAGVVPRLRHALPSAVAAPASADVEAGARTRPELPAPDAAKIVGLPAQSAVEARYAPERLVERLEGVPATVEQPSQDDLVESRRHRGHLLRRWAMISVAVAIFLALSEADRVYFEEGNLWTSWGTVPFGFVFLIFPVEYAVSTIWTLFTCHRLLRGEVRKRNARYTNLPLPRESITAWPTVTVQVPIYTEPFLDVIRPTLDSALAAIRRFREKTGQRANLVVCDDGLLHFADNDLAGFCARARRKAASRRTEGEREVLARLDYYARHGVGWAARAKPIPGVPETERRGRFKKASNLNHAFMLEEALAKLSPNQLATIAEAPRPKDSPLPSGLSPFRFAQWGGNVELGEIILQLDKDSICHPDVILATVPEFIEDPNLAYTQHTSYPTNESDNYFAMMIGAFTRGLYDIAIPSRCQFDGNQVPVMGHNLFLRKSVLVGIGLWGEMTCEDLDFMMRVHLTGQHGKYVAFPGLEFGEAVTRTYTEEVEKFHRYAFGAVEAILNPVRDWERLGVITKSFRRFAASPCVGWYHIVDLIGFFLSMLNIATILPAAVALGLGWIPFGRALSRFLFSGAIFLILGSVIFWQVRRKGNLGRMTQGKAWRGLLGGARAMAAVLVSGICFAGYGVAITRGVLAYLFQWRVSFGATATDDLERVSLGELLRRMKSSHIEAAVLTVVAVGVTWYQSRSPGGTTLAAHFWLLPVIIHISLPYVMNPYLIRRLYRAPLELAGVVPRLRHSLPSAVAAPALEAKAAAAGGLSDSDGLFGAVIAGKEAVQHQSRSDGPVL